MLNIKLYKNSDNSYFRYIISDENFFLLFFDKYIFLIRFVTLLVQLFKFHNIYLRRRKQTMQEGLKFVYRCGARRLGVVSLIIYAAEAYEGRTQGMLRAPPRGLQNGIISPSWSGRGSTGNLFFLPHSLARIYTCKVIVCYKNLYFKYKYNKKNRKCIYEKKKLNITQ